MAAEPITDAVKADAAVKPAARAKGDTVTVACKLPGGLLADIRGDDGAVLGKVLFVGSAAARRLETADDNGKPLEAEPPASVQGGYGLTQGVDADFWEKWLAQNKDYPPVRKGLIFATSKQDSAAAQAREQIELRNGLEPIDPNKPGPGVVPDERHTGKL